MSDRPVALINSGLNCYINSGIQAISACSTFIREMKELRESNSGMQRLGLLCSLMDAMNNKTISGDISKKLIFREWNKVGQQDSFELLTHVINQVYEEIKTEAAENGKSTQWLDVKLPLRMRMTNVIRCECGYEQQSPLQTDIALHLSFSRGSQVKETFWLQKLLDNDFKQKKIQNFKCERSNCVINDVKKHIKLYLPLPETICIHLQRLYWNGIKRIKIKDKVLFCNRITIKKENLKELKKGEDLCDVHYYLKSVIVHDGEESYGHYICYKRYNDTWYYTSDTDIYRVTAHQVFSCNPYILFYEKVYEWQVSPTIIKVDNDLNVIFNALSSCKVFIDWLNKMSVNNDSLIIKRLLYLTNLANGDTIRNKSFEEVQLKEWCNKKDISFTITDVLSELNYDVGIISPKKSDQINNLDEWLELKFSFRINIEYSIACKCGMKETSPIQNEFCFVLSFPERKYFYQESLQVQHMFDKYFDDERLLGLKCTYRGCTQDNMFRSVKLVSPLPETIMIHLKRLNCASRKWNNSSVLFCNRLTVKKEYIKDEKCNDIHYNLKSIIVRIFFPFVGAYVCYRRHNDSWYYISENEIKTINVGEVFNRTPCILFYEREVEMEMSPTILELSANLNVVINALSSCITFMNWLKKWSDRNNSLILRKLLYLTNLGNGNITRNKDFEEKNIDSLYKKGNIYSILKHVLKEIKEHVKCVENNSYGTECEATSPLLVTLVNDNNSLDKEYFERTFNIYDFVDPSSGPYHLQYLLDNIPFCNKFAEKRLPDTICINLQRFINKKNSNKNSKFLAYCNFITLNHTLTKSIEGSQEIQVCNAIKYYLKASIVQESGTVCCMRHIKRKWYRISESLVDQIEMDEVMKYDPSFLFYDIVKI